MWSSSSASSTNNSSTARSPLAAAVNFLRKPLKKKPDPRTIIDVPGSPPAKTIETRTISEELAELQFLNYDDTSDETPITWESLSVAKHGFEIFVEDYVNEMSKHTTKRGKRTNAVNLFASSSGAFKEKIREDYTEILFDRTNVNSDDLEIHLHAASHILEQFLNVQGSMKAMIGYLPSNLQDEGYPTPQAFVFGLVENHILAHMSLHYTDVEHLTPRQASKMIAWIVSYLADMKRQCPDLKLSPLWRSDLARLWQHYLSKGVRLEMRELIQRSIEMWSDGDIRKNAAGELVSGHPEDIAFMVDSQLAVAKKHLPDSSYIESVLVTCNEEIAAMAADLMLKVGTAWKSMTMSRFCSIINDAVRLSEMVEVRNEENLTAPENIEAGESVVRDLAELSLHATNFLCERIVFDLRDPEATLSSIGSPAWEADEKGKIITRTMASFRDLSNLEGWLSSYFFPKVLKKCFDLTMQTYVESFYSNTMAHGVKNAAVVAENLSQDFLNLVIFFNSTVFEKYQGKVGFLSADEIKKRLQVVHSLSRLANPSIPPSELKEDAIRVIAQTTQNSAAILHIAGLRQRHGSENAIEWLQMIAHAEEALKVGERHQGVVFINLPDLRNSRFIRKIRVKTNELHRSVPSQSLQSVEAMKQMIQPEQNIRNFIASKRMVNVFNLSAAAPASV